MMIRLAAVFILLLVAGTLAHANGVVTERKAGGLVFKKTDMIGIASEELFVSRQEIRIA